MFEPTPFAGYLDPGERLLWSGQPRRGVRLQASDIFLVPFSLLWGGFAFFWEAGVLGLIPLNHGKPHVSGAAPLFMAIWGIPFCLIGLHFIFGRFFVDAATRARTWYAITDRRVIILKTFFTTSVTSIDYANLNTLTLTERGDRSGDILFAQPTPYPNNAQFGWSQPGRTLAPGFYLLPDARNVYNQIRDAQSKRLPRA
jgi:hypothetical protein